MVTRDRAGRFRDAAAEPRSSSSVRKQIQISVAADTSLPDSQREYIKSRLIKAAPVNAALSGTASPATSSRMSKRLLETVASSVQPAGFNVCATRAA